jgi:argininosuccinate lyase
VAHGVATDTDLADMPLAILRGFSELISDDVFEVLTLEGSVEARRHTGGTAPERVRAEASAARERLRARAR